MVDFAKKLKKNMSTLLSVTLVFDDKVVVLAGEEAIKYQKHFKNLEAWAKEKGLDAKLKPDLYVRKQ